MKANSERKRKEKLNPSSDRKKEERATIEERRVDTLGKKSTALSRRKTKEEGRRGIKTEKKKRHAIAVEA